LGGIASLVFVLLAIVSLLIWNRVKEIQGKAYSSGRKYRAAFVMLLAVLSCFVFFWQNALHKERVHLQKNQIEKQQDLVESNRTSDLLFLLGNIQDRMDDELSQNPTRILSDETINRISALSYFFKPYLTVGGDSLSEKKLSPERGYLLLAISHMDLDSGCLHKIWSRTSFEWADLRSAELQGADLKGTNLRSADLQGANLQGANLQETNLRAGNLWGANLSQADLTGADMRRAVLSWAGRRHVPGVDVVVTDQKWIVFGDVFIDDWPPNLAEWQARWPLGLAVVPPHPWNVGLATNTRLVYFDRRNQSSVREALRSVAVAAQPRS
jgi:uncharacterized protein YjbI with pentapeptide repeats